MLKHQGVGLVELMISLFLSSLLLSSLMQQYLHCKKTYQEAQAKLEKAYDVLIVSELIRHTTRLAGFSPCRSINQLQVNDRREQSTYLAAVRVSEGKHPALIVSRMSETFASVVSQLSPNQLLLDSHLPLKPNHPLIIADCFHAEIHDLLSIKQSHQGWLVTLKQPLGFNFIPPFYLGEWVEEHFFIANNTQGNSALFYKTLKAEELTSLINDLAVELICIKGTDFVRVTLSVLSGQSVTLETAVRTP